MKNVIFSLLLATLSMVCVQAQDNQSGYQFLRLPVGAHAGALGGDNISITDDDASLAFNNPALMANLTGTAINLNFMNYMEGCNTASAAFSKPLGQKGTLGIMGQFMSYGKMTETSAENVVLGEFSAKDIAISGAFAYQLGQRVVGGITAKFINSYIGQYSSLAVGIDLGINYYDTEREWSLSAVVKNLGGELDAYDEEYTRMPIDVQVGVSKRLVGSPLRLSATLVDLNHLDYKFVNHLVVGADVFLGNQFYVAAGYNFRRANEMDIVAENEDKGSSHGAGLSLGAGVQLERFQLGVAYGKYHVSSHSLMVNLSMAL
ncbi:MAG: type IX secretion system protein PorQ [Prevotella sp.]|nr:type IX secretion system protein PorQ [Prevotella sp.]